MIFFCIARIIKKNTNQLFFSFHVTKIARFFSKLYLISIKQVQLLYKEIKGILLDQDNESGGTHGLVKFPRKNSCTQFYRLVK